MNRRGFLQACLAACVAPAIVRADALMRVIPNDELIFTATSIDWTISLEPDLRVAPEFDSLGEELAYITRRSFVPELVAQIYNTSPLLAALITEADRREERAPLEILTHESCPDHRVYIAKRGGTLYDHVKAGKVLLP